VFRSIFGGGQPAGPAVKQIQVAELKAQLDERAPIVLVDVRQPEEYAQDGHVAGAKLLPLPLLSMRMQELPQDAQIVVICRSGNRSQVAAEQLARAGYTNITNVVGGMTAWARSGFPMRRG
jgi:rhodanese-related sulfurtransferase